MAVTDLCTLDDVKSYVPAYRANDTTDGKLESLITSESELIHSESGREIIPAAAQPETRAFTISRPAAAWQRVEIGDLSDTGGTDFAAELLDRDDTILVQTIDTAEIRPTYERTSRRFRRQAWEPVTALEFPTALGAPSLCEGQTLLVTGTWGFPQVPAFVKEACAKRVILRYVTEVAGSGDSFSEAAAELNLAGLFASARDAVSQISGGVMIA